MSTQLGGGHEYYGFLGNRFALVRLEDSQGHALRDRIVSQARALFGADVAKHPGLERAISGLSDRLGVRVQSHDVLLRGACGRCD